jgi:hypothetical protein
MAAVGSPLPEELVARHTTADDYVSDDNPVLSAPVQSQKDLFFQLAYSGGLERTGKGKFCGNIQVTVPRCDITFDAGM